MSSRSQLLLKLICSRYAILNQPIRRIEPTEQQAFFMPSQMTIPFPSHLNDDFYKEEEVSYGLKDFDAYSIRTILLDDALPPNVSVMPFSTYTKLGLGELAPTKLIVELADKTVKRPKEIAKNVLVGKIYPVDFIVLDMPEDIKTPLILGRPFLSTIHAKIGVFKRKTTLRVRNDKVVVKSDKPTRNIITSVYALSLSERMKLNLEARLIGDALILNRSLDQLYGNYIELNDLNEPLKLRRNQVDDLKPT
ncbi:zinc finger, CCHC-type containing protein, partial [Tanacetum coccineum]